MKRSCLTIMALFTIAILTSFMNMRGKKEDKSIETLWEDFRKAEQFDQINKMSGILEEIKAKARDKRASWDFYKAWDNYVDVKSRRNWKLRDSLEVQMLEEVEEYDEPLLTYLLYRDRSYEENILEMVQKDAARLRKGYNHDVYMARGRILSTAVAHCVRNDY